MDGDDWILPVELKARERFEGYHTLFFQNMAVPKELLDAANRRTSWKKDLRRRFGQWRLDFPAAATCQVEFQEGTKRVLLIARKILTRGRVTLLSPSLEAKLRHLFPFEKFDVKDIDDNVYFALAAQCTKTTAWFDGKKKPEYDGLTPEHKFYERILPQYLGPYYKRFVLPQVHFSSLERSASCERVDFLITLPTKSIVVEIDDPSKALLDGGTTRSRDKRLQENGYRVIRILNQEVAEKRGPNLRKLQEAIREGKTETVDSLSAISKYMLAVKLAHQVQIVVIESILAGAIPTTSQQAKICFDADSVCFAEHEAETIVRAALKDLTELVGHLSDLYGIEGGFAGFELEMLNGSGSTTISVITFNENLIANGHRFIIQDISFPETIAHHERPTTPATVPNVSEDTLRYFLKYIFRYDAFLEGQYQAIARALQWKDSVVLLPTGGGKSLAFQLASLLLPGASIVISPLIALMDDQKDNLSRIGIDRIEAIAGLGEDMNPVKQELIEAFASGEYILCYVSPERLQIEDFREKLKGLTVNIPISLIAIDEAHCVSEWGHDFRTSYLNVGRAAREYCRSHGRTPPVLALTGTASHAVLRAVQRELEITGFDAIITPKTFDRDELHYEVYERESKLKRDTLQRILCTTLPDHFDAPKDSFFTPQGDKTSCGIVFCPHVNGDYGVTEICDYISGKLGIRAEYYCGKKPKAFEGDWVQAKRRNASDFKNNEFPLLVATKGYGMGIDKPNIRYTVHLGLPGSIESFYQQAGRAGRDREKARNILILSNDNKDRTTRLLDPGSTTDELKRIMKQEVTKATADDVTRQFYFHLNSFPGVEDELEDIDNVMSQIENIGKEGWVNVVCKSNDSKKREDDPNKREQDREKFEKAIYRLVLLGVIDDYTVVYPNKFCLHIAGISKEGIIERFCKHVGEYHSGRVATEKEKLLEREREKLEERKDVELPLRDFVLVAAEVLITFIYDTIERGRRRAFREMLSMAKEAASAKRSDQDGLIRERILRYLKTTYSENIEQVLEGDGSFANLKTFFDGSEEIPPIINAPNDAAQVRGETARYLESNPDHPGLLFLRALSELYSARADDKSAYEDTIGGCRSALDRYSVSRPSLYEFLAWMLGKVYNRDCSLYEEWAWGLIKHFDDPDFDRTLMNYPDTDENMLYVPALCCIGKLARKAVNILNS